MSEFDWIRDRFDKVDADNADLKDTLSTVKAKVERHGIYWDITKYSAMLGVPAFLTYLGIKSK